MTRLSKVSLAFYVALLLWFTLDLIGVPRLVARDSVFGVYGLWEAVLIAFFVGYLLRWKYTDFPAGVFIAAWGYLQYNSHWRGFLFGASERQIAGYYRFFAGMVRLFPASQARVIPDAYHTVLGLLIAVNLVLIVVKIVRFFRDRQRRQPT